MNIIAENISRRRKELGMTQRELAEKLNISDKTLSRWETDKQIPDALMIPEIAKALNISISEIYGVSENVHKTADAESNTAHSKEEIDYSRISAYKIVLLAGVCLFVFGSAVFAHMCVYWSYMKAGAMIVLLIGLFAIAAAEFTFEGFYQRQSQSEFYEKIRNRWFGSAILITSLLVGVVVPALKAPVTILFSSWDVLIPLLMFEGLVIIIYTREYLEERKQGSETGKVAGVYIFALLGVICAVCFVINALSNPYRLQGGFVLQDWQLKEIWMKLKVFELSTGIAFFCMNVWYSKRILGIVGEMFRKMMKITALGIAVVGLVAAAVVGVVNHNLQSKVTCISGDVPMYQLTNYSHKILDWIEECNLSGEKIHILEEWGINETDETVTKCLVYMPHGYEDTTFEVSYQLGMGEKVLKIEAENTTQVVDGNYYLAYIEVVNNGETFELQTYFNGERVMYGNSASAPVMNVFE